MTNYVNKFYKDYELLENKNSKLVNDNKILKLRLEIAENEQRRLEKIITNYN